MARPIKKGLDYFPLDTDLMSNRKIRQIKRKYGSDAFLLYITLLCDIYSNGYHVIATDEYVFDLSEQLGYPEQHTLDMIMYMLDLGLFYKSLFFEKRVLTSQAIQEQYTTIKRKISVDQIIDSDLNLVSPTKPLVSPGESTQSKEKEKKKNSDRECVSVRAREEWNAWIGELLTDEDWRAAAVRQSGEGISFNSQLPRHLSDFCDYLVSSNQTSTVGEKTDFARRFHYWWQYHGRKQAHSDRQGKKPQKTASRIEEINRVGDESLALARQIMLKDGIRA